MKSRIDSLLITILVFMSFRLLKVRSNLIVPEHTDENINIFQCVTFKKLLNLVKNAHEDLRTLLLAEDADNVRIFGLSAPNITDYRIFTRALQWTAKMQSQAKRVQQRCSSERLIQDEFWAQRKSFHQFVKTVEVSDKETNNLYQRNLESEGRRLMTFSGDDVTENGDQGEAQQKRRSKKYLLSLAEELLEIVNRAGGRFITNSDDIFMFVFKLLRSISSQTVQSQRPHSGEDVIWLEVNETTPVAEVPDTFLSVALGARLIQEGWHCFNTSSPLLLTLTRALAPAVLRMGGSAANFLTYNPLGDDRTEKQPKIRQEVLFNQDVQPNKEGESGQTEPLFAVNPKFRKSLFEGNVLENSKILSNGSSVQVLSGEEIESPELLEEENLPASTLALDYENLGSDKRTSVGNAIKSEIEMNAKSDDTVITPFVNVTDHHLEGSVNGTSQNSSSVWQSHKHVNESTDGPSMMGSHQAADDYEMPNDSNNQEKINSHSDAFQEGSWISNSLTDGDLDKCSSSLMQNFTNFTITAKDWSRLLDFSNAVGMELLFDVNQFYRNEDGGWDPSNARMLMQTAAAKGAQVIWQLGNEPNAYSHKFSFSISGQRDARDFSQFHQELSRYFSEVSIVGPDVTRPKTRQLFDSRRNQSVATNPMSFLDEFLTNLSINLTAVTWHQYYVNGRTATVESFLSPEVMEQLEWQVQKVMEIRDRLTPGVPVWLTESGSAWGGGAPGLSNTFVAGFLWLDKLGVAARGGVSMVARQTLYQGNYAMLDPYLVPYPDYWVAVLYKRLVGRKVLHLDLHQAPNTVRLYAHCLRNTPQGNSSGGVVIYGLNVGESAKEVQLRGALGNEPLLQYLLQPPEGQITSKDVLLNGILVKLTPNGELPTLAPVRVRKGSLTLPPASLGYWVLPHLQLPVCME